MPHQRRITVKNPYGIIFDYTVTNLAISAISSFAVTQAIKAIVKHFTQEDDIADFVVEVACCTKLICDHLNKQDNNDFFKETLKKNLNGRNISEGEKEFIAEEIIKNDNIFSDLTSVATALYNITSIEKVTSAAVRAADNGCTII